MILWRAAIVCVQFSATPDESMTCDESMMMSSLPQLRQSAIDKSQKRLRLRGVSRKEGDVGESGLGLISTIAEGQQGRFMSNDVWHKCTEYCLRWFVTGCFELFWLLELLCFSATPTSARQLSRRNYLLTRSGQYLRRRVDCSSISRYDVVTVRKIECVSFLVPQRIQSPWYTTGVICSYLTTESTYETYLREFF